MTEEYLIRTNSNKYFKIIKIGSQWFIEETTESSTRMLIVGRMLGRTRNNNPICELPWAKARWRHEKLN